MPRERPPGGPVIFFDVHIGWFVLGGLALLAMTTLPALFARRPPSLPMVDVAAGYGAFAFSDALIGPQPLTERGGRHHRRVWRRGDGHRLARLSRAQARSIDRFGVVGVGLACARHHDEPTVLATIALGAWALGLGLGAAILLGAVLAPTDPVLSPTSPSR